MNKLEILCEALQRIRIITENGADRITEEGVLPLTEDGVPIRKLFIGNIAQRTTQKDLSKLFSKYGLVKDCYLKINPGKSNFAFVTFSSIEEAIRARKDGSRREINLHDRDLRVMPANSWHQPDSVKNKSYSLAQDWNKSHKRSSAERSNEDSIQNYSNGPIDDLNDDCLMHIFFYLRITDKIIIERVCKRWWAVSKKSWSTVKKLDFSSNTWGPDVVIHTPHLREALIRCGRFLTHIDISGYCAFLNQTTLLLISKFCPNLQIIDIGSLCVTSSGIESLAKNCRNIKKLSLGHLSSYRCKRYDTDLIKLFETNKGLRNLTFSATSISGSCLSFLSSDNLEELVLDWCIDIKESHFTNALPNLKNLKSLTIKNCSIYLTTSVMEAIGKYCTKLEYFAIVEYLPLSEITVPRNALHIAQLINLRVLCVEQNTFVNDDFLIALASKCKQLTYLDISDCCDVTDAGLQAITTLPKLETLIMNYLTQITAIGLDYMYNIKHLQCKLCTSISDTGLAILFHVSSNLELLDLSGCIGITNDAINVAIDATSRRSNNTILKIYVGGTSVKREGISRTSPYLLLFNLDHLVLLVPSYTGNVEIEVSI